MDNTGRVHVLEDMRLNPNCFYTVLDGTDTWTRYVYLPGHFGLHRNAVEGKPPVTTPRDVLCVMCTCTNSLPLVGEMVPRRGIYVRGARYLCPPMLCLGRSSRRRGCVPGGSVTLPGACCFELRAHMYAGVGFDAWCNDFLTTYGTVQTPCNCKTTNTCANVYTCHANSYVL